MEFPQILIINLAERTDRWAHIQQEFNSWDTPVHRIDACKHTNGRIGCNQSHKKAVQYAKDHDLPWVLILEDDCKLEKDALQRFKALLPTLWAQRSKWDIFLGCVTYLHKFKGDNYLVQKKPPLFRVRGYTAHFTLIHKDTYNKIIDINVPHIINVTYANEFRLWVTYPHLAVQLPGYSDLVKEKISYTNFFKRSNKILKEILYKHKTRKNKNIRNKTRKNS